MRPHEPPRRLIELQATRSTFVNSTWSLAAIVLAASLIASPAPAAPSVSLVDWEGIRTLTVEHDDLNLATPAGVLTLNRRIAECS